MFDFICMGSAAVWIADLHVAECRAWVQIPLDPCIFILKIFASSCSEQLTGANPNEIKHDHSPVVIVVLDPRYD